jgi:hypothetical protein
LDAAHHRGGVSLDPIIPVIFGLVALALLFAVFGVRSWMADRRVRQNKIDRRLR